MTDSGRAGAGAWRGLGLFFAANVLFGAGLFAHAFLYNFYLEELGHPEVVMGLAAAALTAGGLTALLPAGMVVDRTGPRATFLAASGLSAVGLVAGAFVVRPATIYAAAFVAGAGAAMWRVSMGPIMLRLAPAALRTRAFSWNVALLVGTGAVWTAGAGWVPGWLEGLFGLDTLGGLRGGLVAGAAGNALSALVFLPVVLGAVRTAAEGGRSGAGDAADGARAGGAGAGAADPHPASLADRVRDAVGGLRIPASLAVAVALVAVWMSGGGLVIPFFNLYFLRVHELPVETIGVIFAAAQGLTAVVIFGSGIVASRVGPRRALTAWMLLFPLVVWALPLAGGFLAGAVVLYLLQGLVPPSTNPLIDQILLEAAPEEKQGAVSSWRNGATEISGLVGASLGGWILQAGSFPVLFFVAGGVAAVGAVGLVLALRAQSRESGGPPVRDTRPRTSRQSRSR